MLKERERSYLMIKVSGCSQHPQVIVNSDLSSTLTTVRVAIKVEHADGEAGDLALVIRLLAKETKDRGDGMVSIPHAVLCPPEANLIDQVNSKILNYDGLPKRKTATWNLGKLQFHQDKIVQAMKAAQWAKHILDYGKSEKKKLETGWYPACFQAGSNGLKSPRYKEAEDNFLHHKKVVYTYPVRRSGDFFKNFKRSKVYVPSGKFPRGSYQGQSDGEDDSMQDNSSSGKSVQRSSTSGESSARQPPSDDERSEEGDEDSTDYENYFSDDGGEASKDSSEDQDHEEGDSDEESDSSAEGETKKKPRPGSKTPPKQPKNQDEDRDDQQEKDVGKGKKHDEDDKVTPEDEDKGKHDEIAKQQDSPTRKFSDEDAEKIADKIADKFGRSEKHVRDDNTENKSSIIGDVSTSLKNSIKELADVIKTLSNKLSHIDWNTKVTVPVVVNVSVPHYKKTSETDEQPSKHDGNEQDSSRGEGISAMEETLGRPIFLPAGGLFINSVAINISSAHNGSNVWFRIQKEGTEEGEGEETGFSGFTSSIILGPGNFTVEAYAEEEGYKNSAVVSERFRVVDCGEDQCCSWRVERDRLVLYLAQVLTAC
eukprot:764171-Hanusia_phi.AAC.2